MPTQRPPRPVHINRLEWVPDFPVEIDQHPLPAHMDARELREKRAIFSAAREAFDAYALRLSEIETPPGPQKLIRILVTDNVRASHGSARASPPHRIGDRFGTVYLQLDPDTVYVDGDERLERQLRWVHSAVLAVVDSMGWPHDAFDAALKRARHDLGLSDAAWD